LKNLLPRHARVGILIIYDYGHFMGAKKAVDEYFEQQSQRVYLHRVDYAGRVVVKG
jgi:hypothetical protein